MKKAFYEVKSIWQDRAYMVAMLIVAIMTYGYKITHFAIGIDDTTYQYYFDEGMNVLVGRWVLYLLNKLTGIGDLAPFLSDFLGVVILVIAASLWVVVINRALGEKLKTGFAILFSAVFITCPLISEVYNYFLHNGISIGYLLTALSVLLFLDSEEVSGFKRIRKLNLSAIFLFIAISCYESFAQVFLIGLFMAFLIITAKEKCEKGNVKKNLLRVLYAAIVLVFSIILRALMQKLLIVVFNITNLRTEEVSRSVTEMGAVITGAKDFSEYVMAFKRFAMLYGVFAYAYLPILVFLIACLAILIVSIFISIKNKTLWPFIYAIGMYVSCILLVFIEGKVTLYRAAEFLPIMCGFGILLLFMFIDKTLVKISKVVRPVLVILGCFLILRQSVDLNKWFYMDYEKYEEAKSVMNTVGNDIIKTVENTGKPLVFIGEFRPSVSIIGDAYVPINSEKFYKMQKAANLIEDDMLSKYYRRNRVLVAQNPELSVIGWGATAFDSSYELVRFMNMQGFTFVGTDDIEAIRKIGKEYTTNLPSYPRDGYIKELDDFIVVNFGMGY